MRSSGYGLMVVKTTNFAADAEQTALFGASRCPPTTENCPVYHSKRAKPQQARKTAAAVPPDVLVKPPKCLVTQKITRDKWRQQQRQSATSELRDSANDTKHADADSGEKNRIRDAKIGARSCTKMVVAATATRGATQGHSALTLPNRTKG